MRLGSSRHDPTALTVDDTPVADLIKRGGVAAKEARLSWKDMLSLCVRSATCREGGKGTSTGEDAVTPAFAGYLADRSRGRGWRYGRGVNVLLGAHCRTVADDLEEGGLAFDLGDGLGARHACGLCFY